MAEIKFLPYRNQFATDTENTRIVWCAPLTKTSLEQFDDSTKYGSEFRVDFCYPWPCGIGFRRLYVRLESNSLQQQRQRAYTNVVRKVLESGRVYESGIVRLVDSLLGKVLSCVVTKFHRKRASADASSNKI
jgi:hypothetical protein